MKKILIIAAVAMAALASNAASFSWQSYGSRNAGQIYNSAGTLIGSGVTAVLIDAAVTSQADLLAAARAGSFDLSKYGVSSATTTAASQISATEFTYGTTGNDYTFYYAIFDSANNQLLISSTKSGAAQAADTTAINWTDTAAATFTKTSNGTAAYGSAGWYSAVPEPTSGLLMLVGLGALALRRRRA